MANITRIINQRKSAQNNIESIANNANHAFVIHYSCESFYDTPNGRSARITTIATRNLDSGQTRSFSIHQVAEKLKIDFEKIEEGS